MLTGEYYQEYITSFNTNRHRGFTLDVSYTIGYGKKVKHNNELQPAQGVETTRVK